MSALEYYPFEYYPYAMPVPYYYPSLYYPPPYYQQPVQPYQQPVQPIVLRSGPSGIAIAAFILSLIMILLIGGLYFYWRMFYL